MLNMDATNRRLSAPYDPKMNPSTELEIKPVFTAVCLGSHNGNLG